MTLTDADEAHSDALKFGGSPGVLRRENIEGAIARPYHGYHRHIARKAAALLHGVATSHGFVDGNKRTALLLTEILIERSGYVLLTSEDELIDDIVVAVTEGDMTEDQAFEWFRDRIVRAED